MTNNFGNNLMELRKKNGYSQEDLANKLNVTRQTISKWELEQTSPNLKDLKNIADIFNISLDELTSNIKDNSNLDIKNKKRKNKYILIILFLILIFILLFFVYRVYKILYIKNYIDLACSSKNYYIEKTLYSEENFDQSIIGKYELYYIDGKIKLLTIDNENLSKVNKIEILDDKSYYCIDEINRTYSVLPIEKYYELNLDTDFPILKDVVLNEIYYKFFMSDNKELLKLIFNFDFKVENEFNDYFTLTNRKNKIDSYILLQASTNSNKFEFINKIKKDEDQNVAIQNCYFIELDSIENKDIELPSLLEYQKVNI